MKGRSTLFVLTLAFCLSKFLFVVHGLADTASSLNRERGYKASYNDVWNAAIQVLATRGEIMKLVKKDSGIIGFEQDLEESDFWGYVGTNVFGKIANWVKFRAKVNLLIQEISLSETRILINVQFRGWAPQAYHLPDHFKSNGRLEQEYLNAIYTALP